jgi:hypothetical protein
MSAGHSFLLKTHVYLTINEHFIPLIVVIKTVLPFHQDISIMICCQYIDNKINVLYDRENKTRRRRQRQMSSGRYMNAHEAASELGISLTTLYTYVSRGPIRSEAVSGSRRVRAYLAEDIHRLKERKEMCQHPEQVLSKAISWGEPIIDSELSLVRDGRVYYRGRDAVELAESQCDRLSVFG